MTTINARYGFEEPRTRAVERPDDPLYRAFGEWLKDVPEGKLNYLRNQYEHHYTTALNLVQRIGGIEKKTAEEVQNVLLSYQRNPKVKHAGLFLSACYNTIDETDLVWDLDIDTRVDWIGYKLSEGKRLVLNVDSGDDIGYQSNGLLVNYAYVGGNMASGAEAPSINFGSVGGHMGLIAKAPSVNFGSVGGHMGLIAKAPSVNFGSVGWNMALNAENIQANIAIRNPDNYFHRHGEICLDEKQAKQHPRLVKYFEDFKAEGERYRNTGFPECLGVFEVVERFVGSGTKEEVNKQFMEKLRGLLD